MRRTERAVRLQPEVANDSDNDRKTVIRVKRGALRRYDQLTTKSAGLPVEIKWDRRTTERRGASSPAPADRREGDRRQQPPFTWDAAEFVVVGARAAENAAAPARPPRKKTRGV
jgi:hypothetical protein